MLERAKAFVEALSPANLQALAPSPDAWAPLNPEGQLRVIYGDTDSLFIECRGFSESETLRFAEALAAHTTRSLFVAPISLEAEKTFFGDGEAGKEAVGHPGEAVESTG